MPRLLAEWRSTDTGRLLWPWPIGVALALGLLAGGFSLTPLGLALEQRIGLWALFRLRGEVEPPEDVVIIAIRRDTGERLAFLHDPPLDQPCLDLRVDQAPLTHQILGTVPERWGRCHYVELLRRLALARPAVVALDVVFQPRSDRPGSEDRLLGQAIREVGPVVAAQALRVRRPQAAEDTDRTDYVVDLSRDIAEALAGYAPMPLPMNSSKRVDEFWTFKATGWETPSLAALALQLYASEAYAGLMQQTLAPAVAAGLPGPDLMRARGNLHTHMLAARRILLMEPELVGALRQAALEAAPTPERASALVSLYTGSDRRHVNLFGPAGTIRTLNIVQVLATPVETFAEDPFGLRGKAVFVGYAEDIEWDLRENFSTVFDRGADRLSGVELTATAFSNLLHGSDLKPAPRAFRFAASFVAGSSIAVLCYAIGSLPGGLIALGLMLAYGAVCVFGFAANQRWLPVFMPLAVASPLAVGAALGQKYLAFKQDRARLRDIIEQMVPRDVVDLLRENVSHLGTVKQSARAACVMTDVEGYTSIGDRLSPGELSALLTDYFAAIFRPVAEHGGFVSDLKGDSILAVWRDDAEDNAARASVCQACLDLQAAVERFNLEHPDTKMPTRVGVTYGEVTLGPVGALGHYEYRAVGDTVNASSRVEQLNKDLRTRLLVTGAVAEGLAGFLFRPLGEFALRGRRKATPICELVARMDQATTEQRELCAAFALALEAQAQKRTAEAEARFQAILVAFPNDGPSAYYLNVIAAGG
jgi:adenylate cyclase